MSSNTSTGQIVGYIVGAVAAYFTGGASYIAMGAALGAAVGGAIDPPKGPKIAGPRLSDLGQQTSTYGAVIPRIYGAAAVAGNIFWIENNALKEVATTEDQGGKGGGGGAEVTTYKYYATFALGLCEGPIEGIRRIWVSGRLIYDAGAGDFDTAYATSKLSAGITLHKGSETQTANPRMQATLGTANTPAYRGLAYLVFEDFDLADYGNTLIGAQFKVEVVKSASYSSAIVKQDKSSVVQGFKRGVMSIKGRSNSTRWVSGLYIDDSRVYTEIDDGLFYSERISNSTDKYTAIVLRDSSLDLWKWVCRKNIGWYLGDSLLVPVTQTFDISGNPNQTHADILQTESNRTISTLCEVNGTALAIDCDNTTYNPVASSVVYRIDGQVYGGRLVESSITITAIGVVPYVINNSHIIRYGGDTGLFVILGNNGLIIKFDSGIWSDVNIPRQSEYGDNVLLDSYFEGGLLYRLWGSGVDIGSTTNFGYDVIDIASMSAVSDGYGTFSVNGKFMRPYLGYITPFLFYLAGVCDTESQYAVNGVFSAASTIGIISAGTVQLSSIVSAECQLSSVIGTGDIDVTELTDAVSGYRVSQVAALRSNIEPLQGAWPFDIIQSGYKVRFKKRGVSASVVSIEETQLAARAGSSKGGAARLTQSREMDTQLPVKVSINFLDIGREYDANEQYCERLGTGSVNVRQLEMPIVMSAADAVKKAEVLLYMYWLERYEFSFQLPPLFNGLEPGDVVTVSADGASYQLRLTSMHWQSNGVIDCTARLNDNTTYTSTAVADPGLQYQSTITLRGATSWEMLDIPTLADAQDTPGFIAAIGRYKTGWPGGGVYKSIDGQSWKLLESSNLPTIIGFSRAPIAAPQNYGLIDKASRLQVIVPAATLASVTEGQMLNGANHFAYGRDGRWEIIAAQNCTLQGDGSYILADFLRGRFGTEWAAGQHAEGDRVVMLSSSLLKFVAASANAIGVPILTKGITVGDDLSTAAAVDFAYRGVNLECLAPVYLNGNRSASGDWSLEWVRRGRTGGEWRDNVDVPLGEVAEAYEIEIYSSSSYTTVKRTLTSAVPSVSYTSAQQVADFGSNQSTLYIKVYQMSAIVGRGTPLTTSITR